jgi:predicted permease
MRLDCLTAFRQLRRAPGTALAAILTLAVGIGATTAVFSFVTAVLEAGSPAPDMDRLVALWSHNRGETEMKGLVSPADYFEWSARAGTLTGFAASRRRSFNVSGVGTPIRTPASVVTPSYFELFGWKAAMGRLFVADDAVPGASGVVVLSQAYWQNHFSGRPDIIGQTLTLDGERATIVGVLPRVPGVTEFFVPMELDNARSERSARTLFVMAMLKDGAALDSARAEMLGIGQTLEREFPITNRGWDVNTRPLQEEFVGPQARLVFALLAGTVLTVLLIGCVNIANLLLARGAARRGELAVRLALGAGGWRVVRQLLVECALLAALGGALSLLISRWAIALFMTLGPIDSPWVESGGLNIRVLLLTAAASFLATVIAGLAPALAARRGDLVSGLRATGRSGASGSGRTTRVLVAAQVALAVTLLVMAGLITRTLIAIERLEPGFDMENLLTASVTRPEAASAEQAADWIAQVVDRARQLPGVVSAGATSRLPFAGSRFNPNRGLQIEGQPMTDAASGRWAVDYVVTPALLDTLRVRRIDGRGFTDADGAGAPRVAIVNQTMARRFWPTGSPIGARIRQSDDPEGQWRTVIGIVDDIRNDDADSPPLPYLYVPLAQQPARTMTIVIRASGDPVALIEPLRQAVAAIDHDQPLYDVQTMLAVWEADLASSRLLIQILGALAMIALGLAGVGVWGVTAQSVGQRTREIGVRVALGATAAQVGRLIAWQGAIPIVAGLLIGLAGGLAVGRVMRSLLFQVTPNDPITLIATLAALAAVGLAATLGPSLRAARLDPLSALRTE